MKTFLSIIVIGIVFFSSTASAYNSGVFSIKHTPHREEINYNIPLTEEFQSAFLNALKTGAVIKIEHTVKIRPVARWFGWLAEKKYTKYYKYNLMNDQYYVGVKENELKLVPSLKSILRDVTVLKNTPFLPKGILRRGQAYELRFIITINPPEEGRGLLLFKGDGLTERLQSAVHYIDK